jgi:plastocyanin
LHVFQTGTAFAQRSAVPTTARRLLPALLSLCLAACVGTIDGGPGGDPGPNGVDAGPGGGGGGADAGPGAPDAAPATYSIAVSPGNASLTLGTSADFQVTVVSDRFSGPVTLSAANFPDSWEVSFAPSEIVTQVSGDSSAGIKQAAISLAVANEYIVAIPAGVGGGSHPFPGTIDTRLGSTVIFVNYDGTQHRIHSDGDANGFPHQSPSGLAAAPGDGSPGGTYEVTVTRASSTQYYCHEHGAGSNVGTLAVSAQ